MGLGGHELGCKCRVQVEVQEHLGVCLLSIWRLAVPSVLSLSVSLNLHLSLSLHGVSTCRIPHPSPPGYLFGAPDTLYFVPYSVPPVPLYISSSALPPHTPRCFLLFLLLHQTSNSALLLPLNIFSTPSPYHRPGHLHQPTC
ncbi:uncharacterized protein CCOS01_00682 [Colletotrichum costaricense]|uniref:Uncharacterized protein n=2 Tax=Colletotrichum acutatum species complex TaxID=2707335 RepID=A0AAI9Z9I4_9PEZI|nr:uncharacterized protein CCOS01_00682 [Colletotrichum costaricense]XP_060384125.1 uncharacterized protein CTAM01_05289 [Colletotrichum tamarilloi]KAK1502476.1 hypothetical protein CTAM01_05289 [Colletotrichum tamarilloi]KAK1539368.1 hypothetical protein CCOS01_00682 [Colletotrichum costaricense]